MKAFLVLAICLFATPVLSINLSNEFITGFESGIFLRTNPTMLDEYGCPKAQSSSKEFLQFQ